ncbi:penicillin-binding protein [Bacillus carboniphilus]|uniref:Penicillin-binding protein n=1 Tax=Bacillus carboniphilus TaxID=86663 RepID=A0ABY9JW48_9BACI|nr:penicillin-binding protein [Bacillus carboniphilus]WLR43627.1 penicillin-binding protein [Bacillus carboniphilus]
MRQRAKKYETEKMIGIVANPKTGEILAMANDPSFDPNLRDITNYHNDAVYYAFEPGSTMKTFTVASAIEEGKYNGNETFQSGSYTEVAGAPINDHSTLKYDGGKYTFDQGFQRSSNVAMSILVNEKLGIDTYFQYLDRFGFGKKTGIDLEDEQTGMFPSEDVDTRTKLITSFGQSITVTPIQQIQALTAIANDGKMMKPFLIKKIVDSNTGEIIEEKKPTQAGQPVSPDTAKQVRDLLERVVDQEADGDPDTNGSTGTAYYNENYQVAGKTGTAQMYTDGKIEQGKYIYSFLGLAPKDDPQLVMYVMAQDPKHDGKKAVVDVFNQVLERSLSYLEASTTSDSKSSLPTEITIENYRGKNPKTISEQLTKKNLQPIVIGEGKKVVQQFPEEGDSPLLLKSKLFLVTEQPTMPNLTGWSYRDVENFCKLVDIDLQPVEGTGYVTKQSIKEGVKLKEGDKLAVTLE